MTMTEHPITPPPELVHQWAIMFEHFSDAEVFTQVARWGANQELEACCADIHTVYGKSQADWLRNLRRPKPPSLKKQALANLYEIYTSQPFPAGDSRFSCIRRALEQLDD
jgi:hypothetical protein